MLKKLKISLLVLSVLVINACAQNWQAQEVDPEDTANHQGQQSQKFNPSTPTELTQRVEVYSEKESRFTTKSGVDVVRGQIDKASFKSQWQGKKIAVQSRITLKDGKSIDVELTGTKGSSSQVVLEATDPELRPVVAGLLTCMTTAEEKCSNYNVAVGVKQKDNTLLYEQFNTITTKPIESETRELDPVKKEKDLNEETQTEPEEAPPQANSEKVDYGNTAVGDGAVGSLTTVTNDVGNVETHVDLIKNLLEGLQKQSEPETPVQGEKPKPQQEDKPQKQPEPKPEVKDKKPIKVEPIKPTPVKPVAPAPIKTEPVVEDKHEEQDELPENKLRPTDQSIYSPFREPVKDKNGKVVSYVNGALDRATNFLQLATSRQSPFDILLTASKQYFGTYDLFMLVEKLSQYLVKNNIQTKLAIGTVSLERGGPIYKKDSKGKQTKILAHQSHMNGEDVDISYLMTQPEMRLNTIVRKGVVSKYFMVKEQWELLKYAFDTKDVEVVFVGSAIKKALCKEAMRVGDLKGPTDTGKYAKMLSLINPEDSHDHHFHVRIRCIKANNPRCTIRPSLEKDSSGCF